MLKNLNFLITSIFVVMFAGANLSAQVPTIVSVSPSVNDLGVAPAANISVRFATPIDGSSIIATAFVISGSYTGIFQGTYDYDMRSKTITFDPASEFFTGEVVSVLLTTAIHSNSSTPLPSSYVWSFTTDVSSVSTGFDAAADFEVGSQPHGLTSADFNNDGLPDIASALFGTHQVSVSINDGSGGFATAVSYAAGSGPRSLVAADVNRDGFLDLISANGSTNTISVLINNGDGTFSAQAVYTTGSAPHYVTAADYDGDGYVDIATASFGSDNASVLMNNGDGTFPTHTDYAVGNGPLGICSADLDGDNDFDLITANRFSDDVGVLLNNGDGTFSDVVNYFAGGGARSVFAADLDGDGDLDLATANSHSNDMTVLFNDGTGSFTTTSLYPAGTNPYSVIAGDFDGDDDLDLAVANVNSDDVYVYYNLGGGIFSAPVVHSTGDGSLPLVAADLNGIGVLNLITGNFFSTDISVLPTLAPAADLLIIPSVAVQSCESSCENSVQPVQLHLSQPVKSASIPIAVTDNLVICSVSVAGLVTESWDVIEIDDDKWQDSGYIFVLLANTSGELIPAGITTVFNIHFGATSLCQTSYFIRWDTALSSNPSKRLQFSDTLNQDLHPQFSSLIDSTEILGHEPGDMNGDNSADILDFTAMVSRQFRGRKPLCQVNGGDVNGDCYGPDIADLTYYVDFLFRGGEAPLCGCL